MPIDPSVMDGAQIAGAGGLGGALRAFLSPEMPIKKSVAITIFGFAFAHYFARFLAEIVADKPDINTYTASGFIAGLVGMSVASVIMKLNWREIVMRFVPGKTNTGAEL